MAKKGRTLQQTLQRLLNVLTQNSQDFRAKVKGLEVVDTQKALEEQFKFITQAEDRNRQDRGHLTSNVALYTRDKIRRSGLIAKINTPVKDLSKEDNALLESATRLSYAYLSVLERLDAVSTPQQLRSFLGYKPEEDRLNRELIREDLTGEFPQKAAFSQKSKQILQQQIQASIQITIRADIVKTLLVSPETVKIGSELSSFNQFKGIFSSNIRNWYLVALNELLKNPNNKLITDLLNGIETASVKAFNKELPGVVGSNSSKNVFEALEDMYISLIKTGKAGTYRSKGRAQQISKIELPKIKLPELKVKIPKVRAPQLRTTTGQFYGLVPLQRLLDASLVQRVKDNMGTGSRRDILNLRDGTFAESVKVERLLQSREGMITAFYSYMKYPYATFSKGGVQEFPASRDPKLLIAKSIREIGATMVGNRMRAVLV